MEKKKKKLPPSHNLTGLSQELRQKRLAHKNVWESLKERRKEREREGGMQKDGASVRQADMIYIKLRPQIWEGEKEE